MHILYTYAKLCSMFWIHKIYLNFCLCCPTHSRTKSTTPGRKEQTETPLHSFLNFISIYVQTPVWIACGDNRGDEMFVHIVSAWWILYLIHFTHIICLQFWILTVCFSGRKIAAVLSLLQHLAPYIEWQYLASYLTLLNFCYLTVTTCSGVSE